MFSFHFYLLLLSIPPPLTPIEVELARWPDQQCHRQAIRFNREFRKYCQAREANCYLICNREERENQLEFWQEAIRDTDNRYRAWWALVIPDEYQAGYGPMTEGIWRNWLAQLRRELGEANWWAGQMPLPIPLWATTEVK